MSTTKKSTEQVPFLERPIVRTILPIAGFVIICVLFAILTNGRLFQPKNISLLLSQSYMLLISSIGVEPKVEASRKTIFISVTNIFKIMSFSPFKIKNLI